MQRSTIATVEEYEADSFSVTLYCRTDREFIGSEFKYRETTNPNEQSAVERYIPVTLSFYNPSTFRFECTANPEAGATETLNDFHEAAISDEVSLDVVEEDDQLLIQSAALTVTVGLDSWSFTVEHIDGATIFEEQRSDIDVRGDDRVNPLGFSEMLRNNGPRSVEWIGTAFSLEPDEHLYGFGEKFTNFDKRGQKLSTWTVEPMGTETEKSYKNVPFHLSTRGYGLLVDTNARVEYDLGSTSTASATVEVADDTFSFVFFGDRSIKQILSQYTAFTGRSTRPPKWSFGVWMSRLGYENRNHLESIADRLREEKIPCDVIHLDPFWMREFHSCDLEWDTEQFPDPKGMIEWLAERNFHLSLWEHPYVPVGSEAFDEGIENEYFVMDSTGKSYLMDDLCQGDYRGAMVDFTNPEAIDWWQRKHRDLLEMGVDVFKTDYGEGIPEDAVFENGLSGKSIHNYYPFLYNKTVYEAVCDVNGESDALVWGRSAWIGSQRFPMYWGGDAQTTFQGMASALRGGLGLSVSGFPFWSHDIGGFRGTPDKEVYIRWVQFGLLSSHARCHGTTAREPWAFGEDTVEIFKKYARIRYQLLPYLYSFAEQATQTGHPMVRPLVLEYPDDTQTYDIELQYLLGDTFLIAPVFNESGDVSVYLPKDDEWVDYWSGEYYEGGQTLDRKTELDEMPIFVRANSIVPLGEECQSVPTGTPDEIILDVTPNQNGAVNATFDYYDEDDDALVTIRVEQDDDTLSIWLDDPSKTDLFEVMVSPVTSPPEVVHINDIQISQTVDVPTSDSWSYDKENGELRAKLN